VSDGYADVAELQRAEFFKERFVMIMFTKTRRRAALRSPKRTIWLLGILILLICSVAPGCEQGKDTVETSPFIGEWYSYQEEFQEEYYPVLTFNKDNTFNLYANLYVGMGNIAGTYSVNGDRIECTITSRDITGLGITDTIEEFSFLIPGETLIYQGESIGTVANDEVFYREGTKPPDPGDPGSLSASIGQLKKQIERKYDVTVLGAESYDPEHWTIEVSEDKKSYIVLEGLQIK
jgi:hypothetical protein